MRAFARLLFLSVSIFAAGTSVTLAQNSYLQTDLVCDSTYYQSQGFSAQNQPNLIQNNLLIDAWGIAVRPAGAGGHFWLENAMTGYSVTYQGDVNGVPLHQDGLTNVPLATPQFTDHGYAFVTGTAYNSASDLAGQAAEFPVGPQDAVNDDTGGTDLGNVSGTAKFVFCTQDGCINAWLSNTAEAMTRAPIVVNYSKTSTYFPKPHVNSANPVYTGVAFTQNGSSSAAYAHNGAGLTGNLCFAADQRNNLIAVFEDKKDPNDMQPTSVTQWTDVTSQFHFQTPTWLVDVYDPNTGAQTYASPLHVFNIQDISQHLYVTYAEFNPAGDEGQEQIGGTGLGHVVEYNEDGTLVREFNDGATSPTGVEYNDGSTTPITGVLDEPWGVAIAPATFGAFGGDVLIANFDSQTIGAFDPNTGNFIDFIRDGNGNVITVDGIWGLVFGNGQSLGDANTLYFSAGPNSEYSGLFGKLTVSPPNDTPTMSPWGLAILALLLTVVAMRCLPKRQAVG
jgi:uncharacterized protein (TIGR03118 family)